MKRRGVQEQQRYKGKRGCTHILFTLLDTSIDFLNVPLDFILKVLDLVVSEDRKCLAIIKLALPKSLTSCHWEGVWEVEKRSSDDFLMKADVGRIIMKVSRHLVMEILMLGRGVDEIPRGFSLIGPQ